MNIFVTGGTGFLGAYLLYELLQTDHAIKALKRPSSDLSHLQLVFRFLASQQQRSPEEAEADLQAIHWVEGELLDTKLIRDALTNVDAIYHAAAYVSFDRRQRETIMDTNLHGTTNIVNLALECGVSYFYHVSSVAALQQKPGKLVDEQLEDFPQEFPTTYAESKFRGEREVWRGFAEGLQGYIVNPGVILGPGSLERGAGLIFQQVLKGLRFYPKGGGAYVDARDVVSAMLRLQDQPESYRNRFILVDKTVPVRQVLTHIADAFGLRPPRIPASASVSKLLGHLEEWRSYLTGQPPRITPELAELSSSTFYYDTTKIREHLNFSFQAIEETIATTCHFIQAHELHKPYLGKTINPPAG